MAATLAKGTTVIENAGAERGALLFVTPSQSFSVEVMMPVTSMGASESVPMPLAQCSSLPKRIIHYVARAKEQVVLAGGTRHEFSDDVYMARVQPKSVLCLPILRQQELVAILYLENNLVHGAFTPEKLVVLRVLAAQAAVSLENARLYDELEQRVEERTRELREAQRQLTESAHRAGMAEVTVNLLHSVGNQMTNVQVSAEAVSHLLTQDIGVKLGNTANLLNHHRDDLAEFAASKRGALVPAFVDLLAKKHRSWHRQLGEEMEQLLAGIERICSTLSRQQADVFVVRRMEEIDAGAEIDSVIELHREEIHRRDIELYVDIAADLRLSGDVYKLQQILGNLLTNAIQALSGARGPRCITVRGYRRMEGQESRVIIAITDTGIGIAAEHVALIFSQGFTTRESGRGFGLHYSCIAATELGGSLSVHSDGRHTGATFTLDLPGLEELHQGKPALESSA